MRCFLFLFYLCFFIDDYYFYYFIYSFLYLFFSFSLTCFYFLDTFIVLAVLDAWETRELRLVSCMTSTHSEYDLSFVFVVLLV